MYPPRWGPHFWKVLHLLAFSYHPAHFEGAATKFTSTVKQICYNLPCPSCSLHAMQYIERYPIKVGSRLEAVTWMNNFHNNVNQRLNKKVFTLQQSLESIQRMMEIESEKRPCTPAITGVSATLSVMYIIAVLLMI